MTAADLTGWFLDGTDTISRWCCGHEVDLPTLTAEMRRWLAEIDPTPSPFPASAALDEDEAEAVLEAAEAQPYAPLITALNDLGVVLVWETPEDRSNFLTREDEA